MGDNERARAKMFDQWIAELQQGKQLGACPVEATAWFIEHGVALAQGIAMDRALFLKSVADTWDRFADLIDRPHGELH